MTDKMTHDRLREIREGLADFNKRRLETSMSGGVDTPGRVTYHFGPSPDGLPRYGIVGMLPEIAAELMTEVTRLREHCADLMLALDYSVHELEEHVAPERDRLREQVERLREEARKQAADELTRLGTDAEEIHRLREQVKTLQAELEICRGERFGTDPAAWAKSLPVTEEGPTP